MHVSVDVGPHQNVRGLSHVELYRLARDEIGGGAAVCLPELEELPLLSSFDILFLSTNCQDSSSKSCSKVHRQRFRVATLSVGPVLLLLVYYYYGESSGAVSVWRV